MCDIEPSKIFCCLCTCEHHHDGIALCIDWTGYTFGSFVFLVLLDDHHRKNRCRRVQQRYMFRTVHEYEDVLIR